MLTVIAHYRANPGCSDQIASALQRHQLTSRAEPGCLRFDVHRSIDDPDRFALIEEYFNEAAFQAHRDTDHFRDNIEHTVAPLLAERTWARYTTVDSDLSAVEAPSATRQTPRARRLRQ